MENIKVVIVGNIAYDVNTFPSKDNKSNKIVINNGGAGYYSLIPASIFTKPGIVARIGYDFDFNLLKEYNINLKGLKIINNSKTTRFHHTYLSKDGQKRSFNPEIYDQTLITPEDIPEDYFNAKYIHVSTNFPKTQLAIIKKIRKNSNAMISIDTHEAYLQQEPELIRKIFDLVDIAFIDKEFKNLLNCKAKIKIIKMGKSGCKYISKDLNFTAEAVESDVIDKTGAGDVVTGVFLALLSETNDPIFSLKKAVNIATESIKNYGVDFLIQNHIHKQESEEFRNVRKL